MNKAELKKIPASHFLSDNNSGDCGFKKGDKVIHKKTGQQSIVKGIEAYIPLCHPRDAVCYWIDLQNGITMGQTLRIGCAMEGKIALGYYKNIS